MKEISSLVKNRHIRLFISSTFEDMNNERNYLMRRTFPKLQLLAAERNVMLTAIDLRWGITKEEAENGKVVDACFKEIENSIPFFIGIIGDRYGWCPTPDQVDKETTIRFPEVDELMGLSMTEMEIQFAVLRRKQQMHAYFYIKESVENNNDTFEDETKRQKLAALKKALVNNKRYKAQTYLNDEDLSNKITEEFKSLLDTLFKQTIVSPIYKELLRQRGYRDQLCNTYIKDDETFSFLSNWLSGTKKHLVIFGESGIGKSALLANWTKQLEESKDCEYSVIYHFIGNGGCDGLIDQIQQILVERLYQALNMKSQVQGGEQNANLLEKVITLVAERHDKKILLILDGVNQLIEDDAKSLLWLPELPCNMKVVFSTLREDRTMSTFKNRRYPSLQLRSIKNKHQLIREYLGAFAKKLSNEQIARIAADSQTDNTLVLVSLLNILINFCTYDNLNITIENLLSSESIDDYYKSLIKIYEREYDGNVKTQGLVRSALSLILLSRSGISECDLITIIKTTQFYWSQFFCAFKRNFAVCSGYITLSHQYISKAVRGLYFQNPGWENDCRRALISSLIKRKDEYVMKEIPFQYFCMGDDLGLFTYLCDIDVFAYLYETDKIMLIRYWKKLCLDSQYSLRKYIDVIRVHDKLFEFDKLISLSDFCGDEMNLYNEALLVLELAEKSVKTLTEQEILYNRLEVASHNCGDFNKSLEYCKLYLKFAISNNGYRSLAVINALNDLGVSYAEAKDYKNALGPLLNAVRITKALFGDGSDKLLKLYNNLSTLFEIFEDYNNSSIYYDAALKIEEDKYKNVDLRLDYNDEYSLQAANTLESAASYFSSRGKSKKAIKYYKLALKILHNIYGRYHSRIANIHAKLAEICEWSNENSSAVVKEYLKAASIVKYLYGEKSGDYANYIRKAGNHSDGNTRLSLWTKALQIIIDLRGEKHPQCLKLYMSIAHYYLKEKSNFSQAINILNKILILYEPANFPPKSQFLDRVKMWRLICINQEYLHLISDKIESVIKEMPLYVDRYKKKKGPEYFSSLEKYDRVVRRKIKIKNLNTEVYILTIYLDWIQLQSSKSRLTENRKKYQLMIGIDLDSDRWLASRICGTSIELVRGSFARIQRFIHSLSDNEIKERVLNAFSEKIIDFFTGEL